MRIAILLRFLITCLALALAATVALLLWRHYMYTPWTRDGRVQANVVTIASDVSGLVAEVLVKDNQFVKKGDLLMRIDLERYRLNLAQTKAQVAAAEAEAERSRDEAMRRARVGTDVVSTEAHEQARIAAVSAETRLNEAKTRRDLAELNMARTEVRSPVDGWVTNLNVFPGDYAPAGVPRMAVIDADSFWICGYFEETKLPYLRPGDSVSIEMLDGSPAFLGEVESIARGIGERENPTGGKLLVDVNPTYNWVRLAQRIPVRIRLTGERPPLSVGMSCTVIVHPKR